VRRTCPGLSACHGVLDCCACLVRHHRASCLRRCKHVKTTVANVSWIQTWRLYMQSKKFAAQRFMRRLSSIGAWRCAACMRSVHVKPLSKRQVSRTLRLAMHGQIAVHHSPLAGLTHLRPPRTPPYKGCTPSAVAQVLDPIDHRQAAALASPPFLVAIYLHSLSSFGWPSRLSAKIV
jgi:hypothetical protein